MNINEITQSQYQQNAEKSGFDTMAIWYHGTQVQQDFSTFKVGKGGVNELGPGIYVTRDPKVAETYAGKHGRIIPLYVKRGDVFDAAEFRRANLGSDAGYMNLANKILKNSPDSYSHLFSGDDTTDDKILKVCAAIRNRITNSLLELAGYIGKTTSVGSTQIEDQMVVFSPRSLKSAIGNSGKFSTKTSNFSK